MRILFGPEHDGLHISPDDPGAYEWWYFDAISDDGRYVLVVIFFLGTPMSPYYKAVVDGKKPLPRDWCGVFVSLHERVANGSYKERAYAYNLYRDTIGDLNYFRDNSLRIKLGDSALQSGYSHDGRRITHHWTINLSEPCLWFGTVQAELNFNVRRLLKDIPARGEEEDHSWVCVAPLCQVQGTFTLDTGTTISFHGTGYHDHNFGKLPWAGTKRWFWCRAPLFPRPAHFEDWADNDERRTSLAGASIFYAWESETGTASVHALVFDQYGQILHHQELSQIGNDDLQLTSYGLRFFRHYRLSLPSTDTTPNRLLASFDSPLRRTTLSYAPFYLRALILMEAIGCLPTDNSPPFFRGLGIGEVFEPARLCGPIISRMMWTRIRRRS